jgi:hypothetical protein
MKTNTLVALLATNVTPSNRSVATKRFAFALPSATVIALLIAVIGYRVRPDIDMMLVSPMFWLKLALPLVLAAGSFITLTRLSRPGEAIGSAWAGIAAPVAAVWFAALLVLWRAPPDLRVALLMGKTWHTCPFNITLLSIPGLVAIFSAVRGLAPTQLSLAGAIAGLLSGALGTFAYCFHCPEMEVPFWATWYLLGMAIPTVVGALLGPRLLRW